MGLDAGLPPNAMHQILTDAEATGITCGTSKWVEPLFGFFSVVFKTLTLKPAAS
jgi:hypothetical protein